LKSIHHEKIVQISWKKSINNTEDRIDFMLNDITILKEAQFTKAETKYKNIYLAKVAHEFKIPINSLIYSVNELFEKFPQVKESKDEKIKKQVEFIQSQSNFITILTHDINDYCKDVNDFEINLEPVEIRVVINFAFEIFVCLLTKDQYKKDNVKFNLNISDNVPQFINTDEKRLKQLLINLISNSVKFTNFGHINLNVDYAPKINENTFNELKFCVEDTGIGIKKEDQSKLFQDYSDVNKDFFKMNKEGTGIGLSICKKIIQKLGNNISCESENKITHFKFSVYDFNDCKLPILQESLIHDEETLLIKYPYQDINKIKLDYKKRNFLSSKLVTKRFTKLDFKELPNSERNKSNLNQDSHSNLINSFVTE
jgi:signal transduction histidine kinase